MSQLADGGVTLHIPDRDTQDYTQTAHDEAQGAGGQKCCNDLVQWDLVKCGIEQEWRELAQDRSAGVA